MTEGREPPHRSAAAAATSWTPLATTRHPGKRFEYSLPRARLKARGFARGGHLPAHQRQERRQLVAAALQLRIAQRGKDAFQRRQRKGAKRLGGNPDYDTPPEGWDARDARGRLPGIDEGWDYQPGATVAGRLRPFVPRLADDGELPMACHARGCIIEPDGEKLPLPAPRRASRERLFPLGHG